MPRTFLKAKKKRKTNGNEIKAATKRKRKRDQQNNHLTKNGVTFVLFYNLFIYSKQMQLGLLHINRPQRPRMKKFAVRVSEDMEKMEDELIYMEYV